MASPLNMADFDEVPAAAPAGSPAGGPLDLSEFEAAEESDAAKMAKAKGLKTGEGQTFVRAALNTITLGHADEISGWIDAALEGNFGGEEYRRHRDAYRYAHKKGAEDNPKSHLVGIGAGALATAAVPGLNVARGASVGRAALQGAGMGAVAGVGGSEAELGKGEFGQAALDAVTGAATGAVVGAAGQKLTNWVRGAPARAAEAEVAGLKEGVQYSTKLKTFGKATPNAPEGEFAAPIKAALKSEPKLRKLIEADAPKAVQLVDARVNKLTAQLDEIYAKAQDPGPGVPITKVLAALHKVEKDFERTSATKPLAKTVSETIDSIRDQWAGQNVVKQVGHMPFQALREEYRAWQDIANRSVKLFSSKSPREEVSEGMANAMREALQDHVEVVARRNPSLGISKKLLQETNAEVSTWLRIQRAVTEKATRQNIGATPMGDLIQAVTHPLRTATKAVMPAVERTVDPRLASLIRLSESGDGRAAALLRTMYGVGRRGATAEAATRAGAPILPKAVYAEDEPEGPAVAVSP